MTRTPSYSTVLKLDAASIRLDTKTFGPFSLQIAVGERIAILGPSGAGKTTLLKLMSREWRPAMGEILFNEQNIAHWSLSDLSAYRAVLPQICDVAFGLQTDLVVGLGRVARRRDPLLVDIITASAQLARADHLLGRRFNTLSGGEQARIQLARIFAQLWDAHRGLILVDEPLSAFDPGLQIDLLGSLDTYASTRGHAVVAILHDINLAMLGFDRLLLVKDGKLVADLPASAAAISALESLYDTPFCSIDDSQGGFFVMPLRRTADRRTPR